MLAFLGYLTADLAVRVLPVDSADRLAVFLARIAFALRPPARRGLEANLARLRPAMDAAMRRRTACEAFEHFALSLADSMRLARLDRESLERSIEVRGAEHLERARASGRGVILLSAHAGNWEWGAAWLASHGPPLHIVARPHPDVRVDGWFRRLRLRRGVAMLPGRLLWPGASRALRRREWVALMADRPGALGSVCPWAALLARRTGALVLPALMLRLASGRYAACFGAPLTAEACAAGGYRDALRPHFDRHPGQWFAFEPLPEGLL